MLAREEVEMLIRIAREQHMDYGEDYENAYKRVDAIRGHKARMDELRKIESERKAQTLAEQRDGAREALNLLFVLNGDDCRLGHHISCNVCPFNLGGPCALRSILSDRRDKAPAFYPRDCMEYIAKGNREIMARRVGDEQFAHIKKAVNTLRREEGKSEVE